MSELVIEVSDETFDDVMNLRGGVLEHQLKTVTIMRTDGRVMGGVPIMTAGVTGNQSKNRMLVLSVDRDAMCDGKENGGDKGRGSTAAAEGGERPGSGGDLPKCPDRLERPAKGV